MIAHELKIGQRIYDEFYIVCGTLLTINGNTENMEVTNDTDKNIRVTYKLDNSDKVVTSRVNMIYPIVEGKTFRGNEVYLEILKDELSSDYDYFCPKSGDNIWDFEPD